MFNLKKLFAREPEPAHEQEPVQLKDLEFFYYQVEYILKHLNDRKYLEHAKITYMNGLPDEFVVDDNIKNEMTWELIDWIDQILAQTNNDNLNGIQQNLLERLNETRKKIGVMNPKHEIIRPKIRILQATGDQDQYFLPPVPSDAGVRTDAVPDPSMLTQDNSYLADATASPTGVYEDSGSFEAVLLRASENRPVDSEPTTTLVTTEIENQIERFQNIYDEVFEIDPMSLGATENQIHILSEAIHYLEAHPNLRLQHPEIYTKLLALLGNLKKRRDALYLIRDFQKQAQRNQVTSNLVTSGIQNSSLTQITHTQIQRLTQYVQQISNRRVKPKNLLQNCRVWIQEAEQNETLIQGQFANNIVANLDMEIAFYETAIEHLSTSYLSKKAA